MRGRRNVTFEGFVQATGDRDEAYQEAAADVVGELARREQERKVHWKSRRALDVTARDLAAQSLGWRIHSVDLLPKVPNQSSHDRDERQRIHELLKLELDASASLNQRATTLFALLTATSAAVIAFAGAFWLKRDDAGAFPVDGGTIVIAIVLAALTIVLLALGASLGLWAIVPRSAWREEARALLTLHVVGAPARWHSGVLVDAADKQRVQNEHKAWLLRWQAALAAAGVILAFTHVLIVLLDVAL